MTEEGEERAQYFVVNDEGQWTIAYGEKRTDPYTSRAEAIRAAVNAAHRCGEKGQVAEVLVQNEDDSFRTEWVYGRGPYVPQLGGT